MAPHPPRQSQLLIYLPAHRVLLCNECRYAIQPSAVSRHLKDIHRKYRSDRRSLVEYAQSLDLADPPDVILPKPHEAPVPFLPIENGLACGAGDCGHLCVTVKRMKQHWKESHSDAEPTAPRWRQANIQTFFRDNQLRYFVVRWEHLPTHSTKRIKGAVIEERAIETGSLEASLRHNPDWSADELGLLGHFLGSTYQDLGYCPESRQLWRTTIPQLASSHSFLKHGILACSALHLAFLNPQRQRYQFAAAHHQNRALPSFRSAVGSPGEDNCHALFAFSQLLVIHCFASEEQDDEDLHLVGGRHNSGLPDWLHVIRGSCTIFSNVWQFMNDGPFTLLMIEGMRSQNLALVPETPETAKRLEFLTVLPIFGLKDATEASASPCLAALLILREAFSKARAARLRSTFTVWSAVHIWPVQVSQDYLDLLRNRDPAALILLAHYCILLEPFESYWYMTGFRKRLLSRIHNQLGEEWRQWLRWPMEEAGLQVCI